MRRIAITIACLSIIFVLIPQPVTAEADGVVFLVRHAEKQADGDDPGLTVAGAKRAGALARLLAPAGITAVHSTDYRRTRETAAPVAGELGLEVRHYDPGMLASFAEKLRGETGRHLVVGHSNTTPELVEVLGGDAGGPIAEAWEYDRLYVLFLHPDGGATTVMQRYGAESEPTGEKSQ